MHERMVGDESTATRDEESVGERIRRLRLEKGLTQSALSSPGLTAAQISRIESGARQPSLRAIRRLARALGVSLDYLETGAELSSRDELDLSLADAELRTRLDPDDQTVERDLRALVTLSEREGESELAARARAILGTVVAGWGRTGEAVENLERALAHPLVRPDVFPGFYAALARAYNSLGRSEEALALCEHSLAEARDTASQTILAMEMSQTLCDIGEFGRAERVLEQLGDHSESADPYARARIHWSLARLATARDDRALALRHLRMAISILKDTEDTLRLARAHMFCAGVLLWGGRTGGVASHLRTAGALLPAHAEVEDRGLLRGYEALLDARQHRYDEAEQAAEEALSLLPEKTFEQATALYAQALVLASRYEYEPAEEMFVRVLALAETSKLWREASIVSVDRAETLRWAGKPRESERIRQEARDYAARIGSEVPARA
jgi:transcriptional regulator with XRE-family HTH domain